MRRKSQNFPKNCGRPILKIAVVLSLPIAGALGGPIDFTPIPAERTLEGRVFPELHFHQNGRKITYDLPRDWSYGGGGARFTLVPPQVTQTQVEMQQSALETPEVLDEEAEKLLQEEVLASVPHDAQKVELAGVERNPIFINGANTFSVTVSYTFYGQEFLLNVLFSNLPDTQLRFRCVARKDDFPPLLRTFRGSLCTLAWVEDNAPPATASQ